MRFFDLKKILLEEDNCVDESEKDKSVKNSELTRALVIGSLGS
jgi:hypothetical protein